MKNTIKDKSLNLAVENNFPKKLPSSDLQLGSFSERLQLIAGGRKPRPFALELGIPPSTFHQYFNGQSEPTRPVLSVIADKTGVNMQWLVDGNGPMMKSDVAPSQQLATAPQFTVTDFQGRQLDFKPDPNLIHIPVLSLEAACGMGTFGEDAYITSIVSATEDWFRLKIRKDPHNMCLIHATGDSMEPLIEDGDMVFFDRTTRNHPCDGIWVFSYENNLFLKRLQFLPDNKIKVISSNKAYEPYIITINESFRLFGRYVAILGVRI